MWAIVAYLPVWRTRRRISTSRSRRATRLPCRHPRIVPRRRRRRRFRRARGKVAVQQYACVTCHRIPGIVGAHAPVGPTLEGIATRGVIAGMLPNTTENMVRWLRDPQRWHAGNAMPNLGVTERDARDIAAYLDTLK